MIDGCTRIGALWNIVIPLTAPGVFTAILAFVNAWDEFLLALTLSPRVSSRTLPVGITLYQGEFSFPWPSSRLHSSWRSCRSPFLSRCFRIGSSEGSRRGRQGIA